MQFWRSYSLSIEELVYDWNTVEPSLTKPNRKISFDDETLRDGLQSPSVCEPAVEEKLQLLHLMNDLQIDTADIGLPGAGGTHAAGVERLAREIVDQKLKIRPNCAARTMRSDIQPIVDIAQRTGAPIEACTFVGSSSVRFFAEDWTLDKLLQLTEEAVTFAIGEGLPVMYVTEDTTRAKPEVIKALYQTAIRCGAKAVCVCDTVGHSTPDGARAVVKFVKSIIEEEGGGVRLDWHGHQDRGLGVINSIAAIQGGADQVHAATVYHCYRGSHLVPVAGKVVFIFVNFLAQQGAVGIQQRHLTDVALLVVLVDFLAGQRGAGDREVLVFHLASLDVIGRKFNQHVLAFALFPIGSR